jgi:hypothetical protein
MTALGDSAAGLLPPPPARHFVVEALCSAA